MRKILDLHEIKLLRKIIPIICLAIPWEVYFYSSYTTGWGIKFSIFYANFDAQYGTLFVSVIQQIGLLSNGGFLPSVRTLAWAIASFMILAVGIYELIKENIEIKIGNATEAYVLIICGILTLISSMAVWNDAFKTLPIAPLFFIPLGSLLLITEKNT